MEKFKENDPIAPCNENCSFCFLNYSDILERNNLFRNLEKEQIGILIKAVHHQVRQFGKGDIVAYSGDEYASLFILVKGAVVGEITDFEGHLLHIEHLKAPDSVAPAFLFGDNNHLPVNVTATEETKMIVIHRQDLLQLFKMNATVLHNFLNAISNRTQHLSGRIKLLALNSIRGKIAHLLLDEVTKAGTAEIKLKNTQEELAGMFGVARPSVARAMRELHSEGIIRARGKNITILDRPALSALLR